LIDWVRVWARVLKLLDNYLKREEVIKGMCRIVGHVTEVQTTLSDGFVGGGGYARILVSIDVNKKLSMFVSITKNQKKEFYQVWYEKLPTFCCHYGLLGH
jgi:hypothetical protein